MQAGAGKGGVCTARQGGSETGRHLIGSFQVGHMGVTGCSFYRITAATDVGSLSVLFPSS